MLDTLGEKIENYLKQNYPIFVNEKFGSDLYVYGGLIKDMMIDAKPRDIDLFLMDDRQAILDFIKKYHLKHKLNSFGNPKVLYRGSEVDFIPLKNFDDLIVYNIDGLFYNLTTHEFVFRGFEDFVASGEIKLVSDSLVHPNSARFNERRLHLEKFAEELKKRGLFDQLKADIEEDYQLQ